MGDDSGLSMEEYQSLDSELRRRIERYKDAGFVMGKRKGDVFVMSHRSMVVGGSKRTRYIEYFGYLLIGMATYYVLDGEFISAIINAAAGAAVIYYDYKKKRVTIYQDEAGKIVESGNVME